MSAGGSGRCYNRADKEKLPLIFLIIDDFAGLKKMLDDSQEEFLDRLAAEGIALGIYLIVSAAGPGELGESCLKR